MRTHIGRVVAQTSDDGTTSFFFVPLESPGARLRLSRASSEETVASGEIDLRRYHGHLVSATGTRVGSWILGVISFQASPERPAARRSDGVEHASSQLA